MSRKSTLLLLLLPLLSVLTLPANAQKGLSLVKGSSQYASTAVDVIPSTGQVTVELMVYLPSSGALDGNVHSFVFQGPSGSAFYLGYDGASGKITAGDFWDGGSSGFGLTTASMPTDQWAHLALTTDFAGGSKTYLYVNGVAVDSVAAGFYSYTTASTGLAIGQYFDGATNFYTTATVKNLRIWSVVKTPAQLQNDAYKANLSTTTNLIANYNMEDGNTTAVTNTAGSAGSAGNATLHGAPSYVTTSIDNVGNAVRLNGTNTYASFAANSAYDLATGGTIELWVKPNSLSATNATLVANRGTVGTNYSFHLSNIEAGIWNNNQFRTVPITVVADGNTWTHLAFVSDGSGNTTVYQDAGLVGVITNSAFSGITGQPLTFGIGTPGLTEPFNGAIDEVRIWSTQRTAGEIATNKDLSLTGSETGLVGLWSFNTGAAEGSNQGVTLVSDASPTLNPGTLVNFAGTGSTAGTANYTAHTELAPLPVTLTKFTVVKQGSTALLQWQTAQEQNSKDFSIQRSSDGIKYTGIGTVDAAGTSNTTKNYAFVDPSPEVGKNYYRLLQSDLDGKYSYSPVKVLAFANTGNLVWYTTGARTVEVNLPNGSNENYLITDISGKQIRLGQLSNGRTTLSGMPSGVYVVKVYDKAGVAQTTKVVL